MGMKSMPLSFSPALPCLACRALVTQGLIYQMSSQVWQLLPLCDIHMEEPDEPVPLSTLRCRISEQLAEIQHLQRRKRRVMRAYVRQRRHHAPIKALRALRWQLNRMYKLQAEAMEVVI